MMGERKSRLTLGRLMAVVGIIALGFAMSRVDAAPAVSFCVFAACTWFLANRRYSESLARRAAEGASIGPSQKARIAALCTITAAFAIGLPDAAFLGGYYGYMEVVRSLYVYMRVPISVFSAMTSTRPDLEPQHILFGALTGIVAALSVATMMRRGLWPAPKKRTAKVVNRTASQSVVEQERAGVS
jgi:hypothetical protein